jgi:hypothetical protein
MPFRTSAVRAGAMSVFSALDTRMNHLSYKHAVVINGIGTLRGASSRANVGAGRTDRAPRNSGDLDLIRTCPYGAGHAAAIDARTRGDVPRDLSRTKAASSARRLVAFAVEGSTAYGYLPSAAADVASAAR